MKRLLFLALAMIFCFPVLAENSPAPAPVASTEHLKLGEKVAGFSLQDLNGKTVKLSNSFGKITMIFFWSARCPFMKRYEERIKTIARDYAGKEVVVLGIASNADETLDEIKKVASTRGINYPLLIDTGNKIANQFGAITTPHVFILDREGQLAYEGAVDDQGWIDTNEPKIHYARQALDELLGAKQVTHTHAITAGCTVKRKF